MIKVYGRTDRGKVRSTNQDSFTVKELPGGAALAIVCDGMGGEHGGNVASRNAVNIVGQRVWARYREELDSNSIRSMLLVAASVANTMVHDMGQKNSSLTGMGTTLVACVARGGTAHFAHAGDSRAYLIGPEGITQITRDHSVVQMLVENGELTEEEARVHPKKNYITRAVGVAEQLECEYNECSLGAGETVLICTDGLSNAVAEEEIARIVRDNAPQDAVQALVDAANEAGGHDNITALLLCDR